jgi:hypothetical protein
MCTMLTVVVIVVPSVRHPREGGDPVKLQLEFKLLAWTDPRRGGDDANTYLEPSKPALFPKCNHFGVSCAFAAPGLCEAFEHARSVILWY